MPEAPFKKWQTTLIVFSMIFFCITIGLSIAALSRDVDKVFNLGNQVIPIPPVTSNLERTAPREIEARIQPGSGITVSADNVISLSPIPEFSIMGNAQNVRGIPTTWNSLDPGDLIAGRSGGKLALGAEGSALVGVPQPGNTTMPEWRIPSFFDTPRGGMAPVSNVNGFFSNIIDGDIQIGFGIANSTRNTTTGRLLIPVTISIQTQASSSGDASGETTGRVRDIIVPGYELNNFANCTIYGWQSDPSGGVSDVRALGAVTTHTSDEIGIVVTLEGGGLSVAGHTISLFGTCIAELVPAAPP
jgi:hypothetical protein